MNINYARHSTFVTRSKAAMPALIQWPLNWGRVVLIATWQQVTVTGSELNNAREALRQAKRALLEAESRFDHDCGFNQEALISSIKVAEGRVQAARAALRKIDPWSTE